MPAPWCSACGRPAELLGPSLDPAHPLVRCLYTIADGSLRGCGTLPGLLDPAERAEVAAYHRRRRARKAHAGHLKTKLSRTCPDCRALLAGPRL